MIELDLDESVDALFLGLGYGAGLYGSGLYGIGISLFQVTFPVIPSGTEWRLNSAVCNCSSGNPTTFKLYKNTTDFYNTLATSPNGNQDNVWVRSVIVRTGDVLFGIWTGADLGSQAMLRVLGKKFIPGRGISNAAALANTWE